jgi:penicillin amidase
MKIQKSFYALFFAVVFALCISGQTVDIKGINDAVTVRRDDRSIPYISAQNDRDLYFMQGFQTAGDRLWQMDLLRRLARGETAEIFGEKTLEQDKYWRRYGFAEVAAENKEHLGEAALSALQSYADGVNAYIETLTPETMPVEFRILQYKPAKWSPEDTIVVGKILADALSSTYQQDILLASLQNFDAEKLKELENGVTPYDVVLFGKDAKAKANKASAAAANDDVLRTAAYDLQIRKASLESVGLYAERLAASNNWVISGKRTATGKPILANDPHLRAAAPGIWYLTHLSTPTMRVSGVTFPGVPGVVLGHNEFFAWGATNVGPDVQDVYLEEFNDKGEYRTPDGFVKPKLRKEEIKVRISATKTDTKTVEMTVTETRHGPIVLESGGKRYALKWTALDPTNNELEAFMMVNRAKNWDEFKAALKTYGGATQNFVYADARGNIGWYAAGKIPIRRKGDGALPYNGATTDGDWIGNIPFEELPHLFNPPEGFIVTANQRIVGTDYKYQQLARNFDAPWRARRIHDLIAAKPKITMDDVSDIQHDAFNMPVFGIAKTVIGKKAASPRVLEILEKWDGRMLPDSQGALIANGIRTCLTNAVTAENEPVPAFYIRERILANAIENNETRWMPKGFANYDAFVQSCSDSTETDLEKRFGNDPAKWVWGNVFTANFPHPLAGVPFIGAQFATPKVPIAGSGQTPNVGSNVSMRLIASPGDWDATRHVIPLGQSGDPNSKFYKDQFDKWLTGEAAVFPFSEDAVKKAAVTTANYRPAAEAPKNR